MSSRSLKYYYARKAAGLCVNCSEPVGDARGVQCKHCAKREWKRWKPGSRGRPPLSVNVQQCHVCERRSASDGKLCAPCKARLARMREWKGTPALQRLLNLL